MPPRRHLVPLAIATLALLSGRASAQECSPSSRVSACFDADNLWIRAGSAQFLSVAGTAVAPAGQVSFGFLASFQKRPIVFRLPSAEPGGTDAYAIDDQLNGSLAWSLGLGKGLEFTAVTPIALYQSGVGTSPLTNQQSQDIVRSSLRDARLGLNASLLRRPGDYAAQGLAVGLRGEVVFPSGDGAVYAGGKGVGFAPSAVADYRVGPAIIGVEAGVRARSEVEIAGARIGTQAYQALGVGVDVLGEKLSINAELFALQSFGSQKSLSRDATGNIVETGSRPMHAPAEWLLGVRSAPVLAGDLTFHAGGGTSIPLTDNTVTSPAFRFVAGARYAPVGRDSDGDGILDRDDKCPLEPEDRDGFEDEDGCLDPDNDRDGILDVNDRCRDAPEDKDNFEDNDGCPDLDDDGDGIPDLDDRCRNDAEDKDGFQDEDGCPDPDNDNDGIPDAKDVCPNGAEDFDGFRDEDGCPEPDNDGDKILDAQDKCPLDAEDYDGFEDEDGCSEPDNDNDGILDAKDKCPTTPETINGVDDDDGCPEANAKDLVTLQGARLDVSPPLRFAAGKSKMTADIERALKMIAQKARGVPRFDRLVIETYGDGPAPAARQETLANERAEAIRAVLLASGLTAENVTVAVGDIAAKRPPKASHADFQLLKKR